MANNLSKQSIEVFRLLVSQNKAMSTRRLSLLLGISQQNVYRLLEPLIKRRMVRYGSVINKVYRANQEEQARLAYMHHAAAEFDRLFADAYREAGIAAKVRN